MPCVQIGPMIVCYARRCRLRTSSGKYIYVEWSHKLPYLFHDKNGQREVEDWWERPDADEIDEAMRWYAQRGYRG